MTGGAAGVHGPSMGRLVLSAQAMYLAGVDISLSMDAPPFPLFPAWPRAQSWPDPRGLGGSSPALPRRARPSDPRGSGARARRRGARRLPAGRGDPAARAGRGGRGGGDDRAVATRVGDRVHAAAPPCRRGLAGRRIRSDRARGGRLPLQGRRVAGDPAGDHGGGARRDRPRSLRPDRHRQGDPPAGARRSPRAQPTRAGDTRAHRRRADGAPDRPATAPQHGHRENSPSSPRRWATSALRAARRTAPPSMRSKA
jgi:hypothetical protein